MESEWREYSLTDLYTISSGLSKPAEDFGEGCPFLAFKDVFYNYFIPEKLSSLVKSTDREQEVCSVRRGDVFLTRTSETMHELGMSSVALQDHPRATFNGFCKRLRPKDGDVVYPEFIGYALRSPGFRSQMMAFSTMSTRASLNNDMIGRLQIILPPLPEQKAIAHILGSLDDKIELNRKMNQTLEAMAQALFKSWFVDFDPVIDNAIIAGNPVPEEFSERAERRKQALANGIANREVAKDFPDSFVQTDEMGWVPEGWEVVLFEKVSSCFDNKRVPLSKKQREAKQPGLIPYYGATSVMDYINEWIFDDIYLLIGEDGSVLKEDGSPFVQYIWGKAWVNNHAHVLRGKNGISTEHLLVFISEENISAYVTGAVQMKLNQKNMNRIPFLKASDIINFSFDQIIQRLFEMYRNNSDEIKILAETRDFLLPRLLSGECQVHHYKEIEDEQMVKHFQKSFVS